MEILIDLLLMKNLWNKASSAKKPGFDLDQTVSLESIKCEVWRAANTPGFLSPKKIRQIMHD